MMEEAEEFKVARFGIEVEQFVSSPIGQYLIERAEQHRNAAIESFKKINVADIEAAQKAQNDLKIPDLLIGWLQEAIQSGSLAEKQIKEEDE